MVDRVDGHLPIGEYGLIGDCRSAALVGSDGSIDWLCLPRFDDPSIFGRILDAQRGGHWRITPRGPHTTSQRYRDRTNLLETVFTTPTGRVVVTDFMPIEEGTLTEPAAPHEHPRLVRIVDCIAGEVALHCDILPAPDYARCGNDGFTVHDTMVHADHGELHLCVRATVPLQGMEQTLRLSAGETVAFALVCNRRGACDGPRWDVDTARRLLRQTQRYWWRWIAQCVYNGPFQQPVWRSALVLKLMTYAPTGAIVAAPTTSLPECIGGVRNWDYRYTWLRDASLTLYALFQLDLRDEANAFFTWLTRLRIGTRGTAIDNLYTLDGGRDCEERELEHLSGYRGSRPVRVGNGAAQQLQLDVYGELLDSAYLYARFGGRIDASLWRELHAVVDIAIARWEERDSSIWEVRGGVRHFTYSKVMCWVAVDRGLRIAERFGLPHETERWRSARRAMHRRVIAQGWSEELQSFTQTLGGDTLDAALLRLAQVRFLSDHDPRMHSTVEAISRRLRRGALVRRYHVAEGDDGFTDEEGAFLLCSFWLVDALAHQGEVERAQRLFERLLAFGSPLELFAEEADVRTGELLGNHPQAFTHLALVGAAVNIERARQRRLGRSGGRGGD